MIIPKFIDVFPFCRIGEDLNFLLLRRAVDNTYPGIWQPVAGKMKPEETAWEAGLRELSEETGFTPLNFYTLDHVSSYYLHSYDETIHVPAFIAEVQPGDPTLSAEHDKFQWLPLEAACALASWEPYRIALISIPKLLASSPALAVAKILQKNGEIV
ncbi:MAG: NUDIX pyrophosphatase [Candidatus Marinimicrobia bacterium]|nr:NUDIX pyrophosphatase [Candidatus Neomarinimicrobiota bacterium]